MTFNQPLGGNTMPRFGGWASMMRLPMCSEAAGLDAAFIGVPLDIGTSHRPGARFGPRQIRAESSLIRPYNMATGAAPLVSSGLPTNHAKAATQIRPRASGPMPGRVNRPSTPGAGVASATRS